MKEDYNPPIGEYFISRYNTLCLRISDDEYQDLNLQGKTPLAYVPGNERFCAKRPATNREMVARKYIPLQIQNTKEPRVHSQVIDNSLCIKMAADHDTKEGLGYLEKTYIEHIFKQAKYNQCEATRMLGISRGTLRTKLKKYFGDQYI